MRYRDRYEADLVAVVFDVRSHALWIASAAAAFPVSEPKDGISLVLATSCLPPDTGFGRAARGARNMIEIL
jgi:hypothetical protein